MTSLVATAFDAAGNASSSANIAVNVANASIADATPPVVRISQPVGGMKVSSVLAVRVEATDNAGSAGLSQTLYIDGKSVATASSGTLSYSWNTRKASVGGHVIQAVAQDAAGNSASQSVRATK